MIPKENKYSGLKIPTAEKKKWSNHPFKTSEICFILSYVSR